MVKLKWIGFGKRWSGKSKPISTKVVDDVMRQLVMPEITDSLYNENPLIVHLRNQRIWGSTDGTIAPEQSNVDVDGDKEGADEAGTGDVGEVLGDVQQDPPGKISVPLNNLDNFQIGMLIAMAPRLANMVGQPGAAVVYKVDSNYFLEYDPDVVEWDEKNGHLSARG